LAEFAGLMTVSHEPLTRNQRIAVTVTAVVVALTRLLALAKGPWDWDEILFCMAVQDYDILSHQPHPPGFPFYIFLARIARLFVDSDFHSLQIVNVVAAMLVFPVMFAVARSFRLDFIASFWAAFLFAFLPNVWFYGGTAFSDIPAMLLFLGTIAAFMFAARNGKASTYFLASIILAAGLMVRPQNTIVAFFPWALATWNLARAKRWRIVIAGASLTIGLTILGYSLGAWATGFVAYFDALYRHFLYVRAADSVTAAIRPPLYKVVAMMLDPYQAGKVSVLMNVLALIGVIRFVTREPRQPMREIFLTFAPFFLFAMFAVNPLGSSRFSLNWIAGIVLLAALGTATLADVVPRARVVVFAVFLAIFAGRLIPWTLPAFDEPRRNDAPPVAAAKWVAANVPLTSTVFVDESIWPWAKYYIPNHKQARPHDPVTVVRDAGAESGVYLSMFPAQVRSERIFVRPRNRTWNLVTQRSFEAYVTPSRLLVSFDNGWYMQEGEYPNIWRWSSRRASIRFAPMTRPGELHLKFEVPVDVIPHPVRVTFSLNGKVVGTHVATTLKNDVRLVLHPRSNGVNTLRIELSDTIIPARLKTGNDWRQLGLMLESWEWTPLEATALRKAS
jgi:4-amino-4-deoxy-L-arabinose transferase-like glycosyltransferase